MSDDMQTIFQAVMTGDGNQAAESVTAALESGLPASTILNEGLIAAMDEVGKLFEQGDFFVPEMLVSARAMQAALNILRPHLVESDVKPVGKMALGTVKGDLHDIGKNLVGMMVEGAGFEIIDLGTDVPPEAFVAAIRDDGANLVGLSALLTTTMPRMQDTIQAIEEAGLRDSVKVIVGGAPITADFAEQVGADGYASDASRAAALAKSLIA